MNFTGFTKDDFEVFKIEGLDNRMDLLRSTVRPKLEVLGHHFSPTLSTLTGDEMFYHVAKHARRSVNPPKDTWVAYATNKRGYKMLPHFQIGLWESHLFVWFAVIYESPVKEAFGKVLKDHIGEIKSSIPNNFVWSVDHTKPDALSHLEIADEDFCAMFERLQTKKKSEILCGINILRNQIEEMSPLQQLDMVEDTFRKLIPLYQLSQNISKEMI